MFFVEKSKIGTTLGAQKEFSAAQRRGVGFMHDREMGAWHYLWPADLLEPGIRKQYSGTAAGETDADAEVEGLHIEPTHYVWTVRVVPGEVIGEPVIAPYSGIGDWITEAKSNLAAALAAEQRQVQ